MITEQLKNYIKEAKKSGKTNDEIHHSLLGAGWKEMDIAEALNVTELSSSPTPPEAPVPHASDLKSGASSFFDSLKALIKRPRTY